MCVLHVVCFHLSSFFVERFSDPDTFQVSFIQTFFVVSIIKTPRLTIDRLDELFIKFWTLEGAVTERGAAITIWPFIVNDQSNRLPKFR